ncbi:MAG: alpha/beta hydrolase [Pedosphaera sp.]|nr:alpha/beta hydrolase [Pedosphaera sp.]
MKFICCLLFGVWGFAPAAPAQTKRPPQAAGPKPDLADFKYGPHERNVLDLWKAKSDQLTPLVVFIHGGGFRGGSKAQLAPALLDGLLKNGISVMAINYRLSPEVKFPAHYLDCARAPSSERVEGRAPCRRTCSKNSSATMNSTHPPAPQRHGCSR